MGADIWLSWLKHYTTYTSIEILHGLPSKCTFSPVFMYQLKYKLLKRTGHQLNLPWRPQFVNCCSRTILLNFHTNHMGELNAVGLGWAWESAFIPISQLIHAEVVQKMIPLNSEDLISSMTRRVLSNYLLYSLNDKNSAYHIITKSLDEEPINKE